MSKVEKDVDKESIITDGLASVLSAEETISYWEKSSSAGRISTGIPPLDAIMGGGLPVGQVCTVVGYTGTRKSELLRQIRRRVSKKTTIVIHVDVELGPSQIAERELCQRVEISPQGLQHKYYGERLAHAKAQYIKDSAHIKLVQTHGILTRKELQGAVVEAVTKAREEMPNRQVLLLFDSVQRLAPGFTGSGGDPRVGVQNCMYWMDNLSRTLDVAILATSERSRPTKKQDLSKSKQGLMETLMSGAESRAIEYVSHTQMALFPVFDDDAMVAIESDARGDEQVRIMITKNRSGSLGWLPAQLIYKRPFWGFEIGGDFQLAKKEGKGGGVLKAPEESKLVEMLVPETGKVTMAIQEAILGVLIDGKRQSTEKIRQAIRKRHEVTRAALLELAESGAVVAELNPQGVLLGWRMLSHEERLKEEERQRERARLDGALEGLANAKAPIGDQGALEDS